MIAIETIPALAMLAAAAAYVLLGGADFGGGVWDLLSRGPMAERERRGIAEAIGPVWEANHVWLIFLVVILFTCYPRAYAAISVDLFWPLHLMLLGIVLRGASFVLRAYGSKEPGPQKIWGAVFGAASAATPLLLGACLGAMSTGRMSWLEPFPLLTGLLGVAVCAWLAAVYLAWESEGPLREAFRSKALVAWLVAGAISLITLIAARAGAPRLWEGLTSLPAGLPVAAGILLAPASATALWRRRAGLARVLGAGQVVLLLLGWGMAQWPYIVYPDLPLEAAAAPPATLRAAVITLPFGLALVLPSLWLLFKVFKSAPRSSRSS